MKIIVYAHQLELGGTQVNAIELAVALRDRHGFTPTLFATPGPAVELAQKERLRFIPAPDARFHPSLGRMRALRAAINEEKPDLVYAWDWWQGLEAYYSVHLPTNLPIAITDMMMDPTRVLPREIPTTFGTPKVLRQAISAGWLRPSLLLPPVDIGANAPGAADGGEFRAALGIAQNEILIVSVSRLSGPMKTNPLKEAIKALHRLGRQLPLKLLIVGEGYSRSALGAMAAEVNHALGRSAVVLVGPLVDPRPAYAAAQIVLGMGGSALRAMAFGKPVIILGADGFAKIFSAESAGLFHDQGMFGWEGGGVNSRSLERALIQLSPDRSAQASLGAFGRDYVTRVHSMDVVSRSLADFCVSAAAISPRSWRNIWHTARTSLIYLKERRFMCASRDLRRSETR